ncbi:hypothetical protein BHE74_00047907 [Ensete ventricosum]|nr:hypothetical protein GW17_00052457 [Ensete ventricosum]RWW46183.1 hypothetical protein BHE74_00047907 [Ensete ventricosum]RZS14257.1 hypothetical protein BHM03_00045921 [Ensete ventricosum]
MTKVHPSAAACGATGEDVVRKGFGASVLTVWRKSLLFSCRGFTVFDAEGRLVFRVDTYGSGSTGEVVLMDAAGKPLLTLRRKWLVYDGEDAVSPLYSVKKHANLLHSRALAHVTSSRRGGGGAYGYDVEGSYARRNCTVYDQRRRRVAEIREKEPVAGVAFGSDVFRLVVQSDLDTLLAMAIVIVLDYMFR